MNDATDPRYNSQLGPTLMGFAIGAAVGAGLVFLLAPDSGRNTRERLARGARRAGELAGDALDQARTVAGDAIDQARSATGDALDQARTVTGGALGQARTAAGDLGDDVLSAVKAGRDSFVKDRAGR